jgi:hypothetical protein
MRARIAQLNAEIYRRGADRFRQHFPLEDLPVPPEQFMRVLHALSDGLLFLRFVQPELITDDVIIAAFEMLASRR